MLREEIEESLRQRSRAIRAERRETVEGCVVQAIADAAGSGADPLTVGSITAAFNTRFAHRFSKIFSSKWIGGILRSKLRLETKKSHGVYIVPATEKIKIDGLISKWGIPNTGAR
jgi:hypothetical protein